MTPPGTSSPADMPPSDDIRPQVAIDTGNRPMWIGIGAILVAGLLLFYILEARREAGMAPTTRPRVADLAVSPSPIPPLYIPPLPPVATESDRTVDEALPVQPVPLPLPPIPAPATPTFPQTAGNFVAPPPAIEPPAPQPPRRTVTADTSPAIIFDQTVGDEGTTKTAGGQAQVAPPVAVATRARAGRARDRVGIVPQGTLIAAVLETALDSTQPGQARALVSRDVPNLSGGPVLIPRGSRLYGEYRGEIGAGQKRAMIQWNRLVTPEGITVAIDSPAADQLGRAGIKGKVSSQFASRLGGALLQSVIDFGSFAAVRSLSDSPFFVAVPGAVQGTTSPLIGPPARPTLRVRQGTRISVFVARDLDFTGVGSRK